MDQFFFANICISLFFLEHWEKFPEMVQFAALSFVQYYKAFMVLSTEDKPTKIKEYSYYTSPLFLPPLIKDNFVLFPESQNTLKIYQTELLIRLLRATCSCVYFCHLPWRAVTPLLESLDFKNSASPHLPSSSFSWWINL